MKLNINELNSRLEEYNQISKISFYSAAPKEVILNNIGYYGNNALRIIRRINGDEHWIKNFDRIYFSFEVDAEKKIRSAISAKGGKSCQAIHGERIKQNLNTGTPWNNNTKGNYPHNAWSKGLTKETDDRLSTLSVNRTGNSNPMFGVKLSDESKEMKSKTMKQKILDGTFTPNSNNRNTHWESYFIDKKFRSSWEAIYYALNSSDLYESLRIPYTYENSEHIYIVDFINHNTRIATEIKPKELLNRDKERSKITALESWCDINGYRMNIITQQDILEMAMLVDMNDFDSATQRKIKALNETYKKNRDR